MALFSLKKIAALAQSRQAYLRGISLYNAGRIEKLSRPAHAFYAEFVTADVRDGEDAYAVEIGFNSAGAAEYLYCPCGQYREGMGACKHIIGALADKYYQDMLGGMIPAAALASPGAAVTGEAARRLMQVCYNRDMAALRGAADAGTVRLAPTLTASGGRVLLSLSVGRERLYVVKDIPRFCAAVEAGEERTYGRDFSFVHTPSSFREEDRELLSLLLSETALPTHTRAAAPAGRELSLSPGGVDRLLSLYRGKTLSLRADGQLRTVAVEDGTPPLSVTVRRENGGYRFETDPAVAFTGTGTLYAACGGVLYRTPAAFAAAAGDWLAAAAAEREGLPVADKDMPAFCAKVICRVQKVLPFVGEESFRQYLPLKPETRVYLDCPGEGTVTAGVQFCYGDKQVPLFADVRPDERRDLHDEWRVRLLIQRYFTGFLPDTGEVVFHGDEEAVYTFLTEGLPELEALCTVYASDAFGRLRPAPPPQISVGVNIGGGLLEMDIDLEKWDEKELSALLSAFREHKKFTRLQSGAYVRLDDETMQGISLLTGELGLTPAELKSGRVTLPRYRAWQLLSLLQDRPAILFSQTAVFRELIETLQTAKTRVWPLPEGMEDVLRPYQKEGFYWLKTLDAAGFGGILADDMGLGKTLQIIALLQSGAAESPLPSLVVCPTSLVLNWVSEIRRFAPSLTVLAVTGDAAAREALLQTAGEYRVIVTSYDLLKRDILLYRPLHFRYHVLDEAQYIKNQKTQNARAVKTIASDRRFALTGTPMENRLSELWSIFDFLMPGFLHTYTHFKNRIELPVVRDGERAPLARLSQTVSPFLLRRLKSEVLTELPPKTEQVLVAAMEPEQEKLYAACAMQVKNRIDRELAAGTFEKRRLSVLTLLMRLRQLCCDPSLCVEDYAGGSCKRQMCVELLRQACENGHRVLLFSQFTSMLELLRAELEREGISYMVLKGSTPAAERQRLVTAFNTGDTAVFLISLKAGGTGLNLTGADVVIHYDPWWNVAAEQQATDRAYRIGQQRSVQVLRLVAGGTIEEKILELQQQKQELADAVLSAGLSSLSALSAEQLLALL